MKEKIFGKLKESFISVFPITAIVLLLNVTGLVDVSGSTIFIFILSAVLLIVGMSLFSLGADISMLPIGEKISSSIVQKKSIVLVIFVSFILGVLVTIAEPDLIVLATQVSTIPNAVLISTVGIGVGIFLVIAVLRVVFKKSLNNILIISYLIVFILAIFIPDNFIPVAFDSGGVTTGPITVPFIMAFGVGIAGSISGKNNQDDSFGLVALCSVGPIISMMILGAVFHSEGSVDSNLDYHTYQTILEGLEIFRIELAESISEIAVALLPILVFFLIFQIFVLHLPKRQVIRILIGMAYTFVGIVIFLTAVNVGFMPIGNLIGSSIGLAEYRWILVPLGFVIGAFVVLAEPAVAILNKQVEEVSDGTISKKSMGISLCIGVGISIALSMLRTLLNIDIMFFLIPCYAIALVLSFFVPKIYTAIAFDSGGVASGPMTSTFILAMSIGACTAVGGDLLSNAFGIVAMVAMTPLVTIQILGFISTLKTKRRKAAIEVKVLATTSYDQIIYFE